MTNRRSFLQLSATAAAGMLIPSLSSCTKKESAFTGTISGPNAALGHRLRNDSFNTPSIVKEEKIVIVGGGVAGLSAGRALTKKGFSFRLLELEAKAGGNSRSGSNKFSAYPLGAHYLPIPSVHNKELITFLQESNVITGFVNDLPVYNEYHLCFDPKERLYINHHWQEGLIPFDGIPRKDQQEIERFLARMDFFRHLAGNDGKMAFDIPVGQSSRDPKLLQWDKISMRDFLSIENFRSPYLQWYINYCCADDFGASLSETSAWAGIHYFASRKGKAFNAKSDDVLTWPEGNDWLVQQLKKEYLSQISTQCMVYSVKKAGSKVHVDFFDDVEQEPKRLIADQVILASPQFINKHILQVKRTIDYASFQYAPWMVANLTLSQSLNTKRGEPLCWDNVIYGSDSLGYVNAMHQHTKMNNNNNVITYYKPLLGKDCAALRLQAQKQDINAWKEVIVRDLSKAHSNMNEAIAEMNIWIWGHGMIRPNPGFIWRKEGEAAQSPIDHSVFFAHSDLRGVSLFEEAFYSGLRAAQQLVSAYE